MVTREYQDQNKHFEQKHEEIRSAEVAKREQISSNFEGHISQIQTQMDDEKANLKVKKDVKEESTNEDGAKEQNQPAEGEADFYENEVVKENIML